MEAEIQLSLKRFPDSRISSLILIGLREEGHPATKNSLQHFQGKTAAFNMVTKQDFLEMEALLWLKKRYQNVAI